MAGFRRNSQALRIRPVVSVKHIVDTNGVIVGGTASTTDVIDTVNSPVSTVSNNVANGSYVRALFLNVQAIQLVVAGGINNLYMIVYKNPGNNVPAPAVDDVGTKDKRRFVIHQEMIMTGSVLTAADAVPRTLFKGVIRIPKVYQRNGYDDKFQVVIGHRNAEVTQQTDFCLQCIYKEFR